MNEPCTSCHKTLQHLIEWMCEKCDSFVCDNCIRRLESKNRLPTFICVECCCDLDEHKREKERKKDNQ